MVEGALEIPRECLATHRYACGAPAAEQPTSCIESGVLHRRLPAALPGMPVANIGPGCSRAL